VFPSVAFVLLIECVAPYTLNSGELTIFQYILFSKILVWTCPTVIPPKNQHKGGSSSSL